MYRQAPQLSLVTTTHLLQREIPDLVAQPLVALKARLRVMEWKRRRAEELKTQQEEQATLEQLQRAETETEAARKLAAARAEEAERRIVAERESTADAVKAAESAEKWAKASRQRERRRAEVYAINAVMRYGMFIQVDFALAM